MNRTERAQYVYFSHAVDVADSLMEHDAGNPITVAQVEQAIGNSSFPNQFEGVGGKGELIDRVVRFINTRLSDPFANL